MLILIVLNNKVKSTFYKIENNKKLNSNYSVIGENYELRPKFLREGWTWKSFLVALRSKSYKKDWEQTARPEPNQNFNFT